MRKACMYSMCSVRRWEGVNMRSGGQCCFPHACVCGDEAVGCWRQRTTARNHTDVLTAQFPWEPPHPPFLLHPPFSAWSINESLTCSLWCLCVYIYIYVWCGAHHSTFLPAFSARTKACARLTAKYDRFARHEP